ERKRGWGRGLSAVRGVPLSLEGGMVRGAACGAVREAVSALPARPFDARLRNPRTPIPFGPMRLGAWKRCSKPFAGGEHEVVGARAAAQLTPPPPPPLPPPPPPPHPLP